MCKIGASILLAVMLAGCAQASTVVYYNPHWNERVNWHMMKCYQREATIPEVERCMMRNRIYI